MGKSVDYGSTNAESGKGAGAGHKSDFGEVLPGFAVFGEFVMNELKEFFGEVASESVFVCLVV